MSIVVTSTRDTRGADEPVSALACVPNDIRPTLDFLSQFKVLKQEYVFWGKKYVVHKKNSNIVYAKKSALHEGAYGKIYLMEITDFELAKTLQIPTHLTLKTFKKPHDVEEYNKEKKVLAALRLHNCDESAWVRAVALDKTVLMERMEGTLDTLRGKFSFEEARNVILSLARALLCLYKAGYPYCDMKTYNVLICCENDQYRVLIGDFGSAAYNEQGLYTSSYTPFFNWKEVTARKVGFVNGSEYDVLFGLMAAAIRITSFFDDEYASTMFNYLKRNRYGVNLLDPNPKKMKGIDEKCRHEIETWINLCPDARYRAFLNACLDRHVRIQQVIDILE